MNDQPDTRGADYAERLDRLGSVWWKRLFDVQAPYRRHLRQLHLGFTLDIGCGVGRNLRNLDGNGVGVDHNAASIELARTAGFVAFTADEFRSSEYCRAGRFDALLVAHVLEHMPRAAAVSLVREYLDYVRADGAVVLITPQERGYRSDATHVEFMDFTAHHEVAAAVGLEVARQDSFPFPRPVGRVFPYNEFVTLARRVTAPQ